MSPVRKASNRGRNIIGYFPSIKMKRMINFESLIERDLIYLLDYEQQVEQFWEQPLTIEYRKEGQKRKYTPDFHVLYAGRNVLLECKPWQLVDDADNQIKFAAARSWCWEQGWSFGIMTDAMLTVNWRLENVKLLTRFARYSIHSEIKGRVFAYLSTVTGAVRIADVMQAVNPEAPQNVLIPLLHMAFHHQVCIPLNGAKIATDSPIALRYTPSEKGILPL